MKNLGLILVSFCLVGSASASVDDFETFEYKDGGVFIRLKSDPNVKIRMMRDPNGAKLLSAHPHEMHKQIEVIEYFAGEHGTSQNVRVFHAALYNTKTKRFIGEYPLRYEVVGGGKSTGKSTSQATPQPKWTSDASSIKIFVPDTGETETVEIR